MSIHPTITKDEVDYIMKAIKELSENHQNWSSDYYYNNKTNEFVYNNIKFSLKNNVRAESWFHL